MKYWQSIKNIYHCVQARFWRLAYGAPDRKLKLIGVTGTNGKTTTCYLLDSIFAEAFGRDKVGMLTTVAMRIGSREIFNETKMTTLPSRAVFKYWRDMARADVTHCVVELTSHALDQGRLAGVKLEGAVILNLAREHLDYHRSMAEYAAAKKKILNYLPAGAPVVGKADDDYVAKILDEAKQRGLNAISFTAATAAAEKTPLLGDVNKENAVAARLLAQALNVKEEAVAAGISNVKAVPGRMEWVTMPGQPRVLIDYAVTPDALERLYRTVKQETQGKIFAVLGACGLRDRGKRPLMAQAVAKYADEIVLTREDPWTEPEEQIFSDLESGLKDTRVPWRRIVDRTEAIRYCINRASARDVVVLTGKGAERGMAMGHKIVPWQERQIVESVLQELARHG